MSKKARGVFERDPGSGIYWIRYADAAGIIRREKVGPFQLAVAAYQKRKTDIREVKLFPARSYNRITFGEIADEFKQAKPTHWSIGRKGLPRGDLFTRIRGWFADLPATAVTPQRIEEKLNGLIRSKRTPATANRYRAILSAIFRWAVRNRRLPDNPVRSVIIRREDNHRIRFLEADEEKRLRAAILARNPEQEPEFTVCLHTGMRQGEFLNLTWSDVDLVRGFIFLRKTKAGKPRTVPLNTDAREALEKLRSHGRRRIASGHPRPWFERAIKTAAINEFRWHDLRHTFASRLVMAGVNLKTVQELLGHKTIAMTLRYAHLAPAHLQTAVDAIATKGAE